MNKIPNYGSETNIKNISGISDLKGKTARKISYVLAGILSLSLVSSPFSAKAEETPGMTENLIRALDKKDINYFEKIAEEMLLADGKIPEKYKPTFITKDANEERKRTAELSDDIIKIYEAKQYDNLDKFCEDMSEIGYEVFLTRLNSGDFQELKIKITKDFINNRNTSLMLFAMPKVYDFVDEYAGDKKDDMLTKIAEIYPLTSSPQLVFKVVKIGIYNYCVGEMKEIFISDLSEMLKEKPKVTEKKEADKPKK